MGTTPPQADGTPRAARSAPALLQEFRRAAREMGVGLTIHAVDLSPMAPALHAADAAALMPPVDSEGYVDALIDYCRAHGVDALVPLIDTELPALAAAAGRFEAAGTTAVVSTPEVVRIAQDKVLTHDFFLEHGVETPRVLTGAAIGEAPLPVFMKPRWGSASVGAVRIDTADELAFRRRTRGDDIVLELAEGVEHTVDVFTDFSGRARCAVPRRRHEVRAGEVSKSQTVMHRGMMAASFRVVEALGGCRGMVTLQCFLRPDGGLAFIEINPRFGGGVPLSIRAGADSPRWLMALLLGRQPAIEPDAWRDGLLMLRYDEGIFVDPADLPSS